MKIAVIVALVVFVQVATAASLTDLLNLKNQPYTYTCTPTCAAGKCCVHFYPAFHGGRRSAIDTDFLLHQQNPQLSNLQHGQVTMCREIPAKGDKCLTRNTGEWCDCASGLTCKANGVSGLDAYFGTCV